MSDGKDTSQLKNSLVRIFNPTGKIIGAGFLVTQHHIVTCAHVVAIALGLYTTRNPDALPESEIEVDFPFIEAGSKLRAKVVTWKPKPEDDMARLEIYGDIPFGAEPADLIVLLKTWEQKFTTYGFPEKMPGGVYATGTTLSEQSITGWIQIEGEKTTGFFPEPGFSGAPVIVDGVSGSIGMVVASADDQTELRLTRKVAFIIPANKLVDAVCQDIKAEEIVPEAEPTPHESVKFTLNITVPSEYQSDFLVVYSKFLAEIAGIPEAGYEFKKKVEKVIAGSLTIILRLPQKAARRIYDLSSDREMWEKVSFHLNERIKEVFPVFISDNFSFKVTFLAARVQPKKKVVREDFPDRYPVWMNHMDKEWRDEMERLDRASPADSEPMTDESEHSAPLHNLSPFPISQQPMHQPPVPRVRNLRSFPVFDTIRAGGFEPVAFTFIPDSVAQLEVDEYLEYAIIDDQRYSVKSLSHRTPRLQKSRSYQVLRVRGDSMNRAGIDDGDYVIIERRMIADDDDEVAIPIQQHDIVAAQIYDIDDMATLKRYIVRGSSMILRPESTNPEYVEREFSAPFSGFSIVGVALAVLKAE